MKPQSLPHLLLPPRQAIISWIKRPLPSGHTSLTYAVLEVEEYASSTKVIRVSSKDTGPFTTFEHVSSYITFNDLHLLVVVLYRPGLTNITTVFFEEFSSLQRCQNIPLLSPS